MSSYEQIKPIPQLSPIEKELLTFVEKQGEGWLKNNLSVPKYAEQSNLEAFENDGYRFSTHYNTTEDDNGIRITSKELHIVTLDPGTNTFKSYREVGSLDQIMETITRQWGQDKISQLETLFLQKAIIQEGQTIKTMGWCITELNNKLVNKNYASYSPEEKMQSAELSTLRSELPQHQANLSRLQRYQEQQATKTGNIRQ